jgi:hypothetical protein
MYDLTVAVTKNFIPSVQLLVQIFHTGTGDGSIGGVPGSRASQQHQELKTPLMSIYLKEPLNKSPRLRRSSATNYTRRT